MVSYIGYVCFAHRRLALRWAYGTMERQSYPTDLTNIQWQLFEPLFPRRNPVADQGRSIFER